MERKLYTSLLKWKESDGRKPLILEGARQVGKTYIIKEFGKREYKNLLYVNCHKNQLMEQLFAQNFDTERILRGLSAFTGISITAGETLIFMDEAQEAPHCIESLKYFCEEAPEQHIVVAGSLLGIMDHRGESFPVGKTQTLTLRPMSFEEFLLAKGEESLAQVLAQKEWQLTAQLAPQFEDLLRQYYFVGGMPEAVKCYVERGDLNEVRSIQNEILSNYDRDFSKHATAEAPRIRMVWRSLPSQLAMYEDTNAFKLYMLDIGLLGAMAGMPAKLMLINNSVFRESKGAFTENYVLQQLMALDAPSLSIHYYSKDNSTLEVDFLIQAGESIVPIEVKAEENVNSKSLRAFITQEFANHHLKGLRCSMKDYMDQEWMENIPLYAILSYFTT